MNDGHENALVAKLSQFAPLSHKDIGLLEALCLPEGRLRAGANIVVEGEIPRSLFVVARGMACRYRLMPDGRRQILTILLPGDLFGLPRFLLHPMDHFVAAMGPTRIAAIGREAVIDIIANHPRIGAGLWWSVMQEEDNAAAADAVGGWNEPNCARSLGIARARPRLRVPGHPAAHRRDPNG
jgi:CRP-like cAMP-binding protein